jgi:hypothetical protein
MVRHSIVHADDLQSARLEVIFYFTLLITAVLAWYIFRDLATMLPGAQQFLGMSAPNDKFATPEMSNVYLLFLTAYTGYKEFRRWLDLNAKAGTDQAAVVVPQAQLLRFRRGEVIVVFWALLWLLCSVIEAEHLIPRLLKELGRVALQAILIWLGGVFSEGAVRSRSKRKAETGTHAAAHAQKILDHVAANGPIYNEDCQNLTGLDKDKAYRLLQHLVAQGKLASEGKNKGKRYFKPGDTPAKPPATPQV